MRRQAYLVARYVWGSTLVDAGDPPFYYEVTDAAGVTIGMRDDYLVNSLVFSPEGERKTHRVLRGLNWRQLEMEGGTGYRVVLRKAAETDVEELVRSAEGDGGLTAALHRAALGAVRSPV